MVRVIDGDTIEVQTTTGTHRVRYIGIDTPERGACYFDAATNANRMLVEGRAIHMVKDVSETDRYGRLLRYIYVGDLFVNAELVRGGFALAATFPPDVTHADQFVALQREARDAGRGLWAANACPTPAPRVSTPRPVAPRPYVSPPAATQPPSGGVEGGSGGGSESCHASYPDYCIPPPPPDLNCPDMSRKNFTVRWDVPDADPHGFDRDRDGIGCET